MTKKQRLAILRIAVAASLYAALLALDYTGMLEKAGGVILKAALF